MRLYYLSPILGLALLFSSCETNDTSDNLNWTAYEKIKSSKITAYTNDIFGGDLPDSLYSNFILPPEIENPIIKRHDFSFTQGFYESYKAGNGDSSLVFSGTNPTGFSDEPYNWQIHTLEGKIGSDLVYMKPILIRPASVIHIR